MDGNFTNNWPGLTHFLKTFEPNGEEGRFSDKNFGGKIFRTKILAKRFSDKNFVGKIFRIVERSKIYLTVAKGQLPEVFSTGRATRPC